MIVLLKFILYFERLRENLLALKQQSAVECTDKSVPFILVLFLGNKETLTNSESLVLKLISDWVLTLTLDDTGYAKIDLTWMKFIYK